MTANNRVRGPRRVSRSSSSKESRNKNLGEMMLFIGT